MGKTKEETGILANAPPHPSHPATAWMLLGMALFTTYYLQEAITDLPPSPLCPQTAPAFTWNQAILVLTHHYRSGGTGAHVWATVTSVLL